MRPHCVVVVVVVNITTATASDGTIIDIQFWVGNMITKMIRIEAMCSYIDAHMCMLAVYFPYFTTHALVSLAPSCKFVMKN